MQGNFGETTKKKFPYREHGGFDSYHPTFFGTNHIGDLGLPEPQDKNGLWTRILEIGGICCHASDMRLRAEITSAALGGCNVHHIAYSSDGAVLDLGKAFIRGCGVSLPGDKDVMRRIDNIVNEAGLGKGLLMTKAHSQAGIMLENYSNNTSEEMCKSMRIYTFGSARLLDTNRFDGVINYVSDNDIVPIVANPRAYLMARLQPREDVVFMKSKTLPFIDHPFDNANYQLANDAVNDQINIALGRKQ